MAAFMVLTSFRVLRFYRIPLGFSNPASCQLSATNSRQTQWNHHLPLIAPRLIRLKKPKADGRELTSKPKEIADLHEKLPAVIDISLSRVGDKTRLGRCLGRDAKILQIAVVSHINRGPGV